MKKEHKKDNLVIVCRHIFSACEKGKSLLVKEVALETFTCYKCAKNQPKNKKEFMDMFITLCKCCLKEVIKK